MNFTEFGFDSSLMEGIESMGYHSATPVQEKVIPLVIQGKDVIAAAQTGTGKTAAFVLPLVQKLITQTHELHKINAMVIVPTRELAIQIAQAIDGIGYFTSVSSIAVYGGGGGELFAAEKKALTKGVDIVICTPGRMIAHLNMGYVKLDGLKYLVLDEADRMLDMGFFEDIIKITSYMPKQRQNLMFSATMPTDIRKLANTILKDPIEINIAISKPPEQIVQAAFFVYENQKVALVRWIMQHKNFDSVLIFCSSKLNVKTLCESLKKANLSVDQIQSDMEQESRERVLLSFKNKKLKILVATNIISRGIDIEDINLVINYDVPHDGEDYVHRIGRTARAENTGTAYTFVSENDLFRFQKIEQLIGHKITNVAIPPELGSAPNSGQIVSKPKSKNKKKKFW